MEPRKAFGLLLARFGPQGWWPVTPRGARAPRYRPGRFGPVSGREAEEICIGAILTQNTAWSNAEKALVSLHGAKAASLERVRTLGSRRLQGLIRSSGFFVQKARKLKDFARHARSTDRPLLRWLKSPLEGLRPELLGIHGVGPETADSILLYAGGRPVFVVDAYTKRIGARLGWFPEDSGYDAVQKHLAERLPRSPRVYQEFHALLVALAKRHCRKEPVCRGCPLRRGCRYGARNAGKPTFAGKGPA